MGSTAPVDRVFKTADLLSLVYRYVPPTTVIYTNEDQLNTFDAAFSHRSAQRETSYERLEFLGDAIGTAILTTYIVRRFKREDEAFLTRLRAYLISGKVYAEISRQVGLPGWLRLGAKEEHLRSRSEVHEDVYEAFIGALFLSFGYEVTELWVICTFEEYTDISEIVRRVINPRERLANFCVRVLGKKPCIESSQAYDGETCGAFVGKVYHPITGELVAEGHGETSTRAIGDACESAMDVIMSTCGSERTHLLCEQPTRA